MYLSFLSIFPERSYSRTWWWWDTNRISTRGVKHSKLIEPGLERGLFSTQTFSTQTTRRAWIYLCASNLNQVWKLLYVLMVEIVKEHGFWIGVFWRRIWAKPVLFFRSLSTDQAKRDGDLGTILEQSWNQPMKTTPCVFANVSGNKFRQSGKTAKYYRYSILVQYIGTDTSSRTHTPSTHVRTISLPEMSSLTPHHVHDICMHDDSYAWHGWRPGLGLGSRAGWGRVRLATAITIKNKLTTQKNKISLKRIIECMSASTTSSSLW